MHCADKHFALFHFLSHNFVSHSVNRTGLTYSCLSVLLLAGLLYLCHPSEMKH